MSNVKDICRLRWVPRTSNRRLRPESGLVFVPTNHVCMTYEPSRWSTARQPYVGATLTMFPPLRQSCGMGNFIAWDPAAARSPGRSQSASRLSGALTTAGDVVFYGTLEGYLKAVSTKDGQGLWKFKTPSGIIGNVFTYRTGKQYVACTRASALGGYRHGCRLPSQRGPGAVGGYKDLASNNSGWPWFVFALPEGT